MTSSGRARPPRRGRRGLTAVVGLAGVLWLTGCGTQEPASRPDPEPTAAASSPAEEDMHGDAEFPAPPPAPVDDEASQQAARDAAVAAMVAFARPDLDAEQWWAELSPLLSPAATVAYEGTDPQMVPPRAVTGPPRSAQSPSPYLATVIVPTDAGEYAVLLVREGGDAPWLVERITPTEADVPPDTPTSTAVPPAAGTAAP